MKKIGVLGCGWLGLPLAKHLAKIYSVVKGTSRKSEVLSYLQANGAIANCVTLNENELDTNFNTFIKDITTLVIAINASRSESYFNTMKLVSQAIEKSEVKEVIFLSSTSVYNDENKTIDENEPLDESKVLVRVENIFRTNTAFKTTILRLGGLIGENRNPITSLTGKNLDQNPNDVVNLVQQIDCIHIITEVIKQNCWNETFNVVYPSHPTKQEYYSLKAKEYNLEAPTYNAEVSKKSKIISSNKITKQLNYNFKFTI